jgi:hypothetical protein
MTNPRTPTVALVVMCLIASACETPAPLGPAPNTPLFANAPADGNGNKQVFVVDDGPFTINCGTETIVRHIRGWFQVRTFDQPKNRNLQLAVFHLNFVFTNSAGDQFVWHDVGPDRVFVSDGKLFVAVVGRAGGHIGRLVADFATGEVVFEAGTDVGLPRDQACAALT